MRMLLRNCLVLVLANASLLLAQTLSPGVQPFVKENAPVIALSHVRVIDGTGAPAREDQTVLISGGNSRPGGHA